jgi:hypothetical protein
VGALSLGSSEGASLRPAPIRKTQSSLIIGSNMHNPTHFFWVGPFRQGYTCISSSRPTPISSFKWRVKSGEEGDTWSQVL